MPNCRACGCRIGCDSFSGHWIRETNDFVCDGCYDPRCDEDIMIDEYDIEVAKGNKDNADAALHHWEHRNDDINDAYEQTDNTASCTDIGETE